MIHLHQCRSMVAAKGHPLPMRRTVHISSFRPATPARSQPFFLSRLPSLSIMSFGVVRRPLGYLGGPSSIIFCDLADDYPFLVGTWSQRRTCAYTAVSEVYAEENGAGHSKTSAPRAAPHFVLFWVGTSINVCLCDLRYIHITAAHVRRAQYGRIE